MATMYGQDNLGQNELVSNNEEDDKQVKAGQDFKIMAETNNTSSVGNKCNHFVNKDVTEGDVDGTLIGVDDQEAGNVTEKENLKPRMEECSLFQENVHLAIDAQAAEERQDVQPEDAAPDFITIDKTVDADVEVTKTVIHEKDQVDEADDAVAEVAYRSEIMTKELKTEEYIPATTDEVGDCFSIRNTEKLIPDNAKDNRQNQESSEDSDEEEVDSEVIIMADMEAISEAAPLLEAPETVPDIIDKSDVAEDGMSVDDQAETICSGIDVFLYRIPVDKGLRLEKASKWDLSNPVITGTLSFTKTADAKFVLSVYDDDDGGALYATMEFNHYPSPKLYQTKDSTRYFIAALRNAKDGCTSAMGIGFYCSKAFIQALATNVTQEPSFEPPPKRMKTDHKPKEDTASSSAKKLSQVLQQFVEAKCVCQFCSQKCGTKEQLKKHWADDHGLRHPTHCPYCLDPFPSEKAMKMHRDSRHQHACNKCTLIFVNENEYLEHAYSTHGFGFGLKK